MKKYRKTFNANNFKINYPYTVTEIVEKLGVTKGTVYLWVKEGLKPIDDNLPMILLGRELRRFLKERQNKRKQKCGDGEMFCLKCQLPRRPLEGKTSLSTSKGNNPNLTGKCEVCNSEMFRVISIKNIPEIIKNQELEMGHYAHLIASSSTSTINNLNIGN